VLKIGEKLQEDILKIHHNCLEPAFFSVKTNETLNVFFLIFHTFLHFFVIVHR
jgi:hypothetical protein